MDNKICLVITFYFSEYLHNIFSKKETHNVFFNILFCVLQLRIECILLKFHWGMKSLTEVHFQ